AEKAAEDKLAALNGDKLITPAEAEELTALNDALEKAKTKAEEAVKGLPDGEEKTALEGRLAEVNPITVPEVNDANANDINDDTDKANANEKLTAAEALKAQIEAAKAEAGQAIDETEAGKINGLIEQYNQAKAEVPAAVNAVPEEARSEYSERQAALEDIAPVVSNDSDKNDV
ncbi:GA-like domain-containing protein, partial [Gallibacterium anatis]